MAKESKDLKLKQKILQLEAVARLKILPLEKRKKAQKELDELRAKIK